ncbi:glucokinase [Catalinimonas alkaloidigena]|uniref:Glucokinase n=1 Tax=Catalinimonas alkaloidigena TaxID=1075417 RepID=A0A1G9EJ55_9BACT|nr:ROK family protein [Catalinimonas alkaloidigena]SDK76166.1 glucokinase [Catalinimonas alkaloidigena]
MSIYLGIDIGGTNVKMGLIDPQGNIKHRLTYTTLTWRTDGPFEARLAEAIAAYLQQVPPVAGVGIGIPGTLTKDRRTGLEFPNIPELNGVALAAYLEQQFPTLSFWLENDANAAALGEYYFSGEAMPEDYLFVTLGTGVGGAAIIDRKIFIGGDGNSMEIGHVVSRFERRLESNIGKRGIVNMAEAMLNDYWGKTRIVAHKDEPITGRKLITAAEQGDVLALHVLQEVGEILGEGLVSAIRLLDIKTILVGGGLSATFEFILPGIMKIMRHYLTPYYLEPLVIRRARLGNDAGLLGAAALCF